MKRLAAIVLLFLAAASPPALAAPPAVSPAAGSDAVLALRRDRQDELRFRYRKEAEGKPADAVAVALAADYATVQTGNATMIRDYRLRRLLTVLPDRRLTNNSLFAEGWFRGAELGNRVGLRKVLTQAGLEAKLPPSSSDPFWMETALGVASAALPRPELVREEQAGRTRWLLKGQEVAAVRYRAEPVPAALKAGLRRMWPTLAHIHPQIAGELAAAGRLPQELWLVAEELQGKDQPVRMVTWHWTLLGVETAARAPYPLPAGLAAAPAETRGAFPELFAALADAVATRKLPPTAATYTAHARAALGRGAGLEAFLWATEMGLAGEENPARCTPENRSEYCALLREAGAAAKADPRMGILFSKQPVSAADWHRLDELRTVPLTGVLMATRPRGRDVGALDAEAGLVASIKASAVANFCKDGGDFYLQIWNPYAAWQVLDFGRLMAGHRAGDLLSGVDALEERIQRQEPELF